MEEIQNEVEVVINNVNSKGIIIRNREEIHEKSKNIKPTEYYLDVGDQGTGDEADETQFVTVQNDEGAQFVTVEVADSDQLILPDKEVILWNEICRVCANGSDKEFIPIFSGEGLEHDISNKIHTYLPLRVSENDTLPLQVCYNCAATMVAWDEIFRGCIDAQQRLTELQSKLNLKDHQYYNDSSVEEENMETVLEVETTNNEEPQVEAKDVENLDTLQIVETNRSKGLQRTCTSFKEFQKTYKPVLPSSKLRKKAPSPSKPVKKRTSRALNRRPSKRLSKAKIESENSCATLKQDDSLEDSESSNFADLKLESPKSDSINEHDSNDPDFDVADATVKKSKKSRRKLSARNPGTADGANLECTQCNKKFRMYNSYQIHMRIHTGEKPYTCHICGKQFGQTGSLYYHLKHVHGGVKNHACDICGRCFAMKTAMEDHRRIHTGERPYVCDSCGKTFKTKASLYIHSKIHTNEYPFKCSYCKKLFRWKQQMISHLTTHTGEKNHICDICGKGFGVKNELTRHRRTHSLEKPFTCQKCGVSFGQKRYLTNHNRTRHKTKVTSNS